MSKEVEMYIVRLLCDNCKRLQLETILRGVKVVDSSVLNKRCNYCGCKAFKIWISGEL